MYERCLILNTSKLCSCYEYQKEDTAAMRETMLFQYLKDEDQSLGSSLLSKAEHILRYIGVMLMLERHKTIHPYILIATHVLQYLR